MRTYVIFHITGFLLLIEGFCVLLTGMWSLLENAAVGIDIIFSACIILISGAFLTLFTPKVTEINIRESLLIVVLGWVLTSFLGSLPYIFTGAIPSVTDAVFESVSGFTTTGSSILSDIEALPQGILLWRSITHFLGGMGILILVLLVLPLTGIGGMTLLRVEHSLLAQDKMVPSLADWLKRILLIYVSLVVLESVMLWMAGLSVFDAVTQSFGTIATGGYSTKNRSIASFGNVYAEVIIMVFMFAAGMNFAIYYKLLKKRYGEIGRRDDFRFYLVFTAVSVVLITAVNWHHVYAGWFESLRYSAFQVISISTTTGFATADFERWPEFSRIFLIFLMFIGANAGSTSGAIKNFRIIIFWKCFMRELKHILHPSGVFVVKYNNKTMDDQEVNKAFVFVLSYLLLFVVVTFFLLVLGLDFVAAMSATAATLGGVGPGLGMVGPMANFASVPVLGKWILMGAMLLGRLEIFSFFVVMSPGLWSGVPIKWRPERE